MIKFINYLIIKKRLLLSFPLVIFTAFIPSEYIKKIACSLSANLKQRFSKKNGNFKISSKNKKGINVIGYALYDSGYGEHCRNVIKSFEKSGVDVDVFNQAFKYSEMQPTHEGLVHKIKNKVNYSASIFALNPFSANKFFKRNDLSKYDTLRLAAGYNIAYGFWEMPKLPRKWVNIVSKFDEMWAPTRFVQDIFSKNTISSVVHMPVAIDFNLAKQYTREDFGLPNDKFLFLFSFDIIGYDNRKNPRAVIDAFKLAFDESNKDVALVLKIVDHGDKDNQVRIERMIKLLDLPPHQIYFINKNFTKDEVLGLFSVCDSYVSLHRCEGFGMGIAESMKLGKPTIVTAYSGNMDFTNSENSLLTNYKLVEVQKDFYPLIDDVDVWAEPDIEHAAKNMQKIFTDSDLRRKLSYQAKKFIDEHHNFDIVSKNYIERLKLLGLL